MKRHLLLLAAVLFAGCVSQGGQAEIYATATPPTPQLRAMIVDQARDYLIDPYSVRDAEISGVNDLGDGVTSVCVRFNAKNRMGGYTGRQATAVRLVNGRIVNAYPDQAACYNGNIQWYPLPEARKLRDL